MKSKNRVENFLSWNIQKYLMLFSRYASLQGRERWGVVKKERELFIIRNGIKIGLTSRAFLCFKCFYIHFIYLFSSFASSTKKNKKKSLLLPFVKISSLRRSNFFFMKYSFFILPKLLKESSEVFCFLIEKMENKKKKTKF